ncbi:MAG: dnaG [Candidatus Saccharibacteria bacterium]|nr:dnaG [Candidatus Saccharibacteria bacterium]
MQDAKEEVRSRLNIEDVIGEYVQLKRAGRNFKGLSPFSGEKTPSFVVSPDKHIWHDFSSGRGGDIFTFIMEVEGVDFRQALEHLARKAGVELEVYDDNGGKELAEKKKRLLKALNLAADYYQQSLIKNPHAVEYVFKKRGLSKQIVTDFRVGYAPTSGDALVQFLEKKGFTKKDLSEAGLTNQYATDMFRGRMTVPLMDSVGQVIGFTARTLTDDDPKSPKYLNTPQTILYDKSRHVFGLSQAKEAIRKNDYAVIVEGNLDVISSHQVGITGVVATAGTAMTEYHLRALKRLSENVRLAFDGDKAGLAATERAIPIAEQTGVELTIISLGGGAKDPDELIQKDPELWQQAINNSRPVIDWLLDQYEAREDMSTVPGKAKFTDAALRVIRLLQNSTVKQQYIKLVADKIGGIATNLTERMSQLKDEIAEQPALKQVVQTARETIYDELSYQDNLLALALIDAATHELFQDVIVETFAGEERQAVVKYLIDHGGKAIDDTPKGLQKYDTYVKILVLKADARYADWNDQDRYFETARLLRQVTTEHKQKQKDILTEQLRDAETMGDDAKASEIRSRINDLIKEIQSAKK